MDRERERGGGRKGLRRLTVGCVFFFFSSSFHCDRICHSTRFCLYQQFVLHSTQHSYDSQCLSVRIVAHQETRQSRAERKDNPADVYCRQKNNVLRAKLPFIASLKPAYTWFIKCRAVDLDQHTGQILYSVSIQSSRTQSAYTKMYMRGS